MTKEQIKAGIAYASTTAQAVAEKIGTTKQNFSNKLQRESFTDSDLRKIADAIGAEYKTYFEFSDGTQI